MVTLRLCSATALIWWGSEQRIPYRRTRGQVRARKQLSYCLPRPLGEKSHIAPKVASAHKHFQILASLLHRKKVLCWETWVQVLNLSLTRHVTLEKSSSAFIFFPPWLLEGQLPSQKTQYSLDQEVHDRVTTSMEINGQQCPLSWKGNSA